MQIWQKKQVGKAGSLVRQDGFLMQQITIILEYDYRTTEIVNFSVCSNVCTMNFFYLHIFMIREMFAFGFPADTFYNMQGKSS